MFARLNYHGVCLCPLKLKELGEGSISGYEVQVEYVCPAFVCVMIILDYTYCRHMGLSLTKTILDGAVITILR